MLEKKIKESIIRFVLDSPEEETGKVAIFIAGMQAQKAIETETRVKNPKNTDIRHRPDSPKASQ
jgi:hypothetical protein